MYISTPRPSLRKIFLNDYGAFLLVILILVAWGLFLGSKIFGGLPTRHGGFVADAEGGSFIRGMAMVATAVCAPLLLWRVSVYRQLLSFGRIVEATITSVWFDRDRGRVEFSYQFEGQQLATGNPVMKNKATKAFRQGERVQLAIDPENPKRAVILHLYSVSSS